MTTHRNDLLRDEELTDAFAQALAPAELSAAQRDSMRARIQRRVDATAPPGTITLRAQEGTWHDIAPGVARKVLREDRNAGSSTYLIRMAPGASAPAHSPGSRHADFSTKNGCVLLISSEIQPGL
jgi:hypothetical protein